VSGAEPGVVGDGFEVVFAEERGEPFGAAVALAAFQPDIEEVGEFAVLHIVRVGRVHDDRLHRMVGEVDERGGGAVGERDGAGGFGAGEFGDLLIGFEAVFERPGKPAASDAGSHFAWRWLESEVVAIGLAFDCAARRIEAAEQAVVVRKLIQSERQQVHHRFAQFFAFGGEDFGAQRLQLLHQHAEAQELARAEHVCPAGHAVDARLAGRC
jgi:hypothetical protein